MAQAVPKPVPSSGEATPSSPPRPKVQRQLREQYLRAQVETATQTQLTLLLYDGAIRFCARGLEAMAARDIEAQNTNLIKAQRILAQLMSDLNLKEGGEVAGNLFRVYSFLLEQLVSANLHDQPQPVVDAVQMLRELRDAWQELDRRSAARMPAAAAQQQDAPAPPVEMQTAAVAANSPALSATARPIRRPPGMAPAAPPPAASRLGDRNA